MRQILKIGLSGLAAIILSADVYGQDVGGAPPAESGVLEVAYSASLFYDVDINDARAATKMWVQHLVTKTGEKIGSETFIFTDLAPLKKLMHAKRVDLIILPSLDYLEMQYEVSDKASLYPMVVSSLRGEVGERLALMTHRDSGLQNLEHLQGKRMVIEIGNRGNMPRMWLEIMLQRNGLPPSDKFLDDVKEVGKVSKAILPVFFHQADACIVALDAFMTMGDLNPQVRETAMVLATSPAFCRPIVCARKDIYEKRLKELLDESLFSLHKDVQGQLLLALFHVDQLVPFKPAYLDGVTALRKAYNQLKSRLATGK